MYYANIITNAGPTETLPSSITLAGRHIHNPRFEQCQQVGWRKLDVLPEPLEGQQLLAATFAQDAERPDYATPTYIYHDPQQAALQAVVDAAARPIRDLETIVDRLGLTRPVTVDSARIEARTAMAGMDAEAMDAALADLIELVTLFSGLDKAGIDATAINAAWQYMQATGQDQ